MDMDPKPTLLDRETIKHFLAMTVAGRLKRSIEDKALDPLFRTTAAKKMLQKMTKGNKTVAEWVFYAAGAAVNVFMPEDTPVKRMVNEVFSDTLSESGQRVARTPCLTTVRECEEGETVTILGKTLEVNKEQLQELVGWLDSLESGERKRFFEEVRTLSTAKLSNLLELDQELRTKLLNIVAPAPAGKNTVGRILSRESRELGESLKSLNQRVADKRREIKAQRQERRVGRW
jgi:hypothetical protein